MAFGPAAPLATSRGRRQTDSPVRHHAMARSVRQEQAARCGGGSGERGSRSPMQARATHAGSDVLTGEVVLPLVDPRSTRRAPRPARPTHLAKGTGPQGRHPGTWQHTLRQHAMLHQHLGSRLNGGAQAGFRLDVSIFTERHAASPSVASRALQAQFAHSSRTANVSVATLTPGCGAARLTRRSAWSLDRSPQARGAVRGVSRREPERDPMYVLPADLLGQVGGDREGRRSDRHRRACNRGAESDLHGRSPDPRRKRDLPAAGDHRDPLLLALRRAGVLGVQPRWGSDHKSAWDNAKR